MSRAKYLAAIVFNFPLLAVNFKNSQSSQQRNVKQTVKQLGVFTRQHKKANPCQCIRQGFNGF